MTASVPAATSFSYTGDGSTTAFSFPLRFLESADVEVYVDGTRMTLATDYTVTGAGGPSGGTVTLASAPVEGVAIDLCRSTKPKQSVDLSDSGRTPGDTLEAQLDRLAMVGQDQKREVTRALKVDVGLDDPGSVTPEPGKVVGWGSDGRLRNLINSVAEVDVVREQVEHFKEEVGLLKEDTQGLMQLAHKWAEKDEDVAVEPGEFSAKHHAAKSAAFASAAATSKTGADTAKAGAETAKAGAETARSGAETARDAALATGKIYPDTATGVAAVANGEYFMVPSGLGDESLALYRDVSGVATDTGKRIPAAVLVQNLALNAGMKKYRNLLPPYALTHGGYNSNAFNWNQSVPVPANDWIYRTLGISVEMPGSVYQSPRAAEPIASLNSKWVTVGHLVRDAEGVFHTNALYVFTADNKGGTTGSATHTPAAGGRGTIQLDATHQLHWAQVQMPATGLDGTYLRFAENTSAISRADYIAAPFMAVTDTRPSISEIELFVGQNGLSRLRLAELIDPDPLLDEIGATSLADYDLRYPTGSRASPVILADEEVTNILPSGAAVELPQNPTWFAEAQFVFDAGPGRQNEYDHASIFVYAPDGNFSTAIAFYHRNGTTNTALTSLEDMRRFTQLSQKLRRYELYGQFRSAWSNYGITIQARREPATGTSVSNYVFGAMAAVTPEALIDKQLQPISWVPKGEPIRGFQAQTLAPVATTVWTGKKIVWMGTSIPESSGYPAAVAAALGAGSIANISYGGGAIRAFEESGAPFAQNLLVYKFSLELEDVNALYQANVGLEVSPTNYATLQPGSGFTLQQSHINALVAQNWVARLQPHIADGDLFVFDYGINDRGGQTTFPFQSPAAAGYDRRYFTGAVNYIFKKIYDARKALGLHTRAVFITHHSRVSTNSSDVVDAQIALGKHWAAPVINIADAAGANVLTHTDLIPDGLHFAPNTDIERRIRHQIVEELKKVYP